MAEKKIYGLIGRNISYSFSKKYFTDKFKKQLLKNYFYEVFDIQNLNNISEIFSQESLEGLNVTTPYKELIINHLDELDPQAEAIGAVNTIKIQNGKKIGYNTDVYGFEKSLLLLKKENHKKALILGNGGAAKAIRFVLDKYKIPSETVYRNGILNFENISENIVKEHTIIIQSTPVGTSPNTNDCLEFPFSGITENHLVIDLIYNPSFTKFLENSSKMGAKTLNGLYMLEQQAEKSWEIWNNVRI